MADAGARARTCTPAQSGPLLAAARLALTLASAPPRDLTARMPARRASARATGCTRRQLAAHRRRSALARTRRSTISSRSGSPQLSRAARRDCATHRSALFVRGDAALLVVAAARDRRLAQSHAGRSRNAHELRGASRALRAGDHQRPRARHRCRGSSRRARRRAASPIAVCGTGLDVDLSAREHARSPQRSRARGALVTEFPPGTAPRKPTFRAATASSAGSSLGTLVVEAARAQRLADHGAARRRAGSRGVRDSGLDPQPARARLSSLIRQGAKLVETADDIFAELRALAGALTAAGRARNRRRRAQSEHFRRRYWTKSMKSC